MELIPIAIITTIIFSFVPFLKKILIKDLDIIPFMILVGLIVVPSLIIYYLSNNSIEDISNVFSIVKTKQLLGLLFASAFVLLVGNYCKNYIYVNNEINKAEPILIALSIIVTVLYGYLFFNEKLTVNIILGVLIMIIGIFVIHK